jgi:hypothetical protein
MWPLLAHKQAFKLKTVIVYSGMLTGGHEGMDIPVSLGIELWHDTLNEHSGCRMTWVYDTQISQKTVFRVNLRTCTDVPAVLLTSNTNFSVLFQKDDWYDCMQLKPEAVKVLMGAQHWRRVFPNLSCAPGPLR